jgi:hypothetical protein
LLTKEVHLSIRLFIKTHAFSVVRTSGVAAFPTATDLPPNLTLSGSLVALFIEDELEVAADGAHSNRGHKPFKLGWGKKLFGRISFLLLFGEVDAHVFYPWVFAFANLNENPSRTPNWIR